MDKDRILEYISKTLAARFGNLEDPELSEMMALPSLFTYESGVNSDAQIGRINKFRKGGKEVRIEFELDPALPPFSHQWTERTCSMHEGLIPDALPVP